jgi:hypothetical protein
MAALHVACRNGYSRPSLMIAISQAARLQSTATLRGVVSAAGEPVIAAIECGL